MSAVLLSMDLTLLTMDGDGLYVIQCQGCGTSLNLHQPEASTPDRLLGTCDRCSAWYLIDGDRGLMLRLPEETHFEAE